MDAISHGVWTTQKRACCDGPRRSVAVRSYPSPRVRGGDPEHQAATAQERRRGASPRPGQGWQRRGATTQPRSGALPKRSSPPPEVGGGGREELPHAGGQGQRPRGASPPPRSSCCAWCRRAEFKIGRGGREEMTLVQGKEQRLRCAGAAVKRYPTSKARETQVRW